MSRLHSWPSAGELLEAVAELLPSARDAVSDQHLRFQLRVAVTALSIVSRELDLAGEHDRAHAGRLAELGVSGDEELVALIRAGVDDALVTRLRPLLLADAADRLSVLAPSFVSDFEDERLTDPSTPRSEVDPS